MKDYYIVDVEALPLRMQEVIKSRFKPLVRCRNCKHWRHASKEQLIDYGLGYCDFILKTHHLALTTTLENYCGHGLDWREEE